MNFLARRVMSAVGISNKLTVHQKQSVKTWLAPYLREMRRRKELMSESPPPKRSTYLEWNYSAELYAFSNRLGESIDAALLQEAMTDEHYIKAKKEEQSKLEMPEEEGATVNDNITLAMEGRDIAGRYLLGFLRMTYSRLPEEAIRAIHEFLLSEEVLASTSKLIGTSDLILTMEHTPSQPVLAGTMLAVIGAVARSSGEERAFLFTRDLIASQLVEHELEDIWVPSEPWATLQSVLQRDGRSPPEPRLAFQAGIGTLLPVHCVVIYSDKVMLGKGHGESLSEARHVAALDALFRMFKTTDAMSPVPIHPKTGSLLIQIQPFLTKPNPSMDQ